MVGLITPSSTLGDSYFEHSWATHYTFRSTGEPGVKVYFVVRPADLGLTKFPDELRLGVYDTLVEWKQGSVKCNNEWMAALGSSGTYLVRTTGDRIRISVPYRYAGEVRYGYAVSLMGDSSRGWCVPYRRKKYYAGRSFGQLLDILKYSPDAVILRIIHD